MPPALPGELANLLGAAGADHSTMGGKAPSWWRKARSCVCITAKSSIFASSIAHFVAALYKLVLFIATLARLLIAPIAWLERGARREQHLTLARRYWQLLGALPGM